MERWLPYAVTQRRRLCRLLDTSKAASSRAEPLSTRSSERAARHVVYHTRTGTLPLGSLSWIAVVWSGFAAVSRQETPGRKATATAILAGTSCAGWTRSYCAVARRVWHGEVRAGGVRVGAGASCSWNAFRSFLASPLTACGTLLPTSDERRMRTLFDCPRCVRPGVSVRSQKAGEPIQSGLEGSEQRGKPGCYIRHWINRTSCFAR